VHFFGGATSGLDGQNGIKIKFGSWHCKIYGRKGETAGKQASLGRGRTRPRWKEERVLVGIVDGESGGRLRRKLERQSEWGSIGNGIQIERGKRKLKVSRKIELMRL